MSEEKSIPEYPNDVVMVKYDIIDPFGTPIGRGIVPMVYVEAASYGIRTGTRRISFVLGENGNMAHSIQFYL